MKKRSAPPKTKAKGKLQAKGRSAPRKTLSLWAVIAIILAAGMILSSVFIGIDYLSGWRGPGSNPGDSWQDQLEKEQQRLAAESALLEAKIAAEGPTVEDLEKLAETYQNLFIYAMYLNPGTADQYLEKTAGTYRSLLKLEPGSIEHRFALFDILRNQDKEAEALEQAEILKKTLEALVEAGTATNLERYYFAVLQVEAFEDKEAALEQIALILETEPKDSSLYSQALKDKEQLEAEGTADGEGEKKGQGEGSPSS